MSVTTWKLVKQGEFPTTRRYGSSRLRSHSVIHQRTYSRMDVLVVGDQGRVLQTRDGGETWEGLPTLTSVALFGAAYHGGNAAWVAGRGGTILKRTDTVATVKIPRPKLPPALRPAPPKLKPGEEADALAPVIEDDIPRATPPKLKP